MKNILTRNTKTIIDISMAEKVGLDTARMMFVDNLDFYTENGVMHGPDNVDYAALSKEWDEMSNAEHKEAVSLFKAMDNKCYEPLGNAYRIEDWDTFNKILEAWV